MLSYSVSVLVFFLAFTSALACGSANILNLDSSAFATVLWDIRLPRVCLAALCGGAQAIAGVLCQGLFRNSLASPSVLGTANGATLAGVLAFYFGGFTYTWYSLPLAASLGAFAITLLLLAMLARGWCASLSQVLVLGFALSSFLAAATSLVLSLSLADYQKTMAMMYWLMGGFAGSGWQHVLVVLPPLGCAFFLALQVARRLDIFALGEEVASSLGINRHRLQLITLAAISLAVGASVCVGGSLPFVSLIVPHFCRLLVGGQHRRLLVISWINGMSLSMVADLLARTVLAPVEIEIGIFTSLLGAPFFIALLLKRERPHALV